MSKELVQQLSEDEPKVYFPDIERPDHNPILRFLSDNLDNPDTKEYLGFYAIAKQQGLAPYPPRHN